MSRSNGQRYLTYTMVEVSGTSSEEDGCSKIAEKPIGVINEYHYGRDCLYAKDYGHVLANCLRDVPTPLTVGLFSCWGSGKSFLLKCIQDELRDTGNKSPREKRWSRTVGTVLHALFLLLLLAGIVQFIPPAVDDPVSCVAALTCSALAGLLLLFYICAHLSSSLHRSEPKGSVAERSWSLGFADQLRLLFVALFTRIPRDEKRIVKVKEEEEEEESAPGTRRKRRFIMVNFNAWEYMGSDVLWAAIVTTLVDRVEKHFGRVFSRLFRSLGGVSTYPKIAGEGERRKGGRLSVWRHLAEHPSRSFGGLTFFWWVWSLLVVAAVGVVAATKLSAITIAVASVCASMSVLVGAGKLVWSQVNSQRRRVERCVRGVGASLLNELGFMKKIKFEVKIVEGLINLAEFVLNEEIKIVVSIDDLDRVPYTKVKSVLDAVQLLLSGAQAPFICLLAVDSRVAVKSCESEFGVSLRRAHINGYEYLAKIVNLSFHLPDIGLSKKELLLKQFTKMAEEQRGTIAETDAAPSMETTYGAKKFNNLCRELLRGNEYLSAIESNPRKIKRLHNILSITCSIVNHFMKNKKKEEEDVRTEDFAKRLVAIIFMFEMWPYRTCLILHQIQHPDHGSDSKHLESLLDAQQRSLLEIYKDVKGRMDDLHLRHDDDPSLMSLDADPLLLEKFLKTHVPSLEVAQLPRILRYVVSLDTGLLRQIAINAQVINVQQSDLFNNLKRACDELRKLPLLASTLYFSSSSSTCNFLEKELHPDPFTPKQEAGEIFQNRI